MLIVGPGTFHLGNYLFCHQFAITLSARHLYIHEAVLIEWRKQRPERLLHREFVVVLEFAVQLSPGVGNLRWSQFPRLAFSGANACYVAIHRMQPWRTSQSHIDGFIECNFLRLLGECR